MISKIELLLHNFLLEFTEALTLKNCNNGRKKFKLVVERLENIVGKGENAKKPAFSPFPKMF